MDSFPDLTVESISTIIHIKNEGDVDDPLGYEYNYVYCITDSVTNLCDGVDDIYNGSGSTRIKRGIDYYETVLSTVPAVGNYYFHLRVQYGSKTSSAYKSFTVVAGDPVTPPVVLPGGGGGGGSGSSQPSVPPVASCLGADFNGDGIVNSVDFSIMLAFWKTSSPFRNSCVDMNIDKQVNSVDFSILLSQWGRRPTLSRK